jgi:hypothetical protein
MTRFVNIARGERISDQIEERIAFDQTLNDTTFLVHSVRTKAYISPLAPIELTYPYQSNCFDMSRLLIGELEVGSGHYLAAIAVLVEEGLRQIQRKWRIDHVSYHIFPTRQ